MKVKIMGSGGCVSTPRPCCSCRICTEAREKGFPYARTGCSLFIEDINVLIDTPEDINYAINHSQIQQIDHILFSHCDPDHTMGIRVIEQLKLDWLSMSAGKKMDSPIDVASLPGIMDDLWKQTTKYGSMLEYYESKGLVYTRNLRKLQSQNISIELIPVDKEEHVTVFLISDNSQKIIYAPCDVKPFPESEKFYDADILIIGNTIVGDVLKNGFIMDQDNPLKETLFSLDEVMELREKYRIREVIITHLEEEWGKSYDDYKELEKNLPSIRFAFDGMEI